MSLNYEPLFGRAGMLVIKSRVDILDQRLATNGEWNLGEKLEVGKLLGEIKVMVDDYKKESKPSLERLEKQFADASVPYQKLYEATVGLMGSGDSVIAACSEAKKHVAFDTYNQSSMELAPVYSHATAVHGPFSAIINGFKADGVEVKIGKIKKLFRVIEKIMMGDNPELGCGTITDLVRALLVCQSNDLIAQTVASIAMDKRFAIHHVRESYSTYEPGKWLDVKLIVALADDPNQHKIEVQICHDLLCTAREKMGGHDAYSNFRSLDETIKLIKKLSGAVDGVSPELMKLEKEMKDAKAKKDVQRCRELKRKIELQTRLDAENRNLQMAFDKAMEEDDFDLADELQGKMTRLALGVSSMVSESAAVASLSEPSVGIAAEPDSMLSLYPSEPQYHTINKKYPGLVVLHKEPWIFEVPNFVSKSEAQDVMIEFGTKLRTGTTTTGSKPKGWDFENEGCDPQKFKWLEKRIKEFTNGLDLFCTECAIVMKYSAGSDGIAPHMDHVVTGSTYRGCGRVITMFIYLNEIAPNTGQTFFTKLNLHVKPAFGKMLCFFPGALDGTPDKRLEHAGLATKEEKWLLRFFLHGKPVFKDHPMIEFDSEGRLTRYLSQFDGLAAR